MRRDLATARQATAKYHDPAVAVADGYHATDQCVAVPGLGTMGYHYVKFESITPQHPEVAKPGGLLYIPSSDGPRLVGVEYFQVDRDQDVQTDGDRPTLFGVPFDGPMPGHEPGMPVHYDLHVWTWAHNPDGMFAQWNPALSC